METTIIWMVTMGLIGIVFLPYYVKFRRKKKEDFARKEEAVSIGMDKPMAQYPHIDALRCMGCGSCLRACPEKEVLGIVYGKSTIINGIKCIGCGCCAKSCPVNGIIIGLGDIKNRDDIPTMNQFNETNIPGLFIAGELAGFALIKNAIEQGTAVAQTIAKLPQRSSHKQVKDLIIVGAGPAGLSAALTAIKYKMSYIVLDQQGAGGTILQYPRKKLVMTEPVAIPLYGWLKKYEYYKEELLDIWNAIVRKFNLNVKVGDKLTQLIKKNGNFQVTTQNGIYYSRNVILAIGRRGTPRKLGVPGEKSSKVMYQLMDAESYQHEQILIVGGGDSAAEAAVALARQESNRVTLSYRKEKFFRIKRKNMERIQEMISARKLGVVFNSNVTEIQKNSVRLKVKENHYVLRNDYVFVFAGGEPPFKLLKNMGIAFGGGNGLAR